MDAWKIQHAYLRALYTGTQKKIASPEEEFVVAGLSTDRLEVERAARIRNLRTVMFDDMRLLNRVMSKGELLPFVEKYAQSEQFWMHRGRTLVEDFCLFFVEHAEVSDALALLARLEGVYSGLSASTEAATPWAEHKKQSYGTSEAVEHFVAPLRLAFEPLFREQLSYEPVREETECIIRRTGHAIRIKFNGLPTCNQLA
ncbi:hypothetical protein ACVBGC_28985 [Burkholderia stagnalis]